MIGESLNFGEIVKGNEVLRDYVANAVKILAPSFDLHSELLMGGIPRTDFFYKYRSLFFGTCIQWCSDASLYFIPPEEKDLIDLAEIDNIEDTIFLDLKKKKAFGLVPRKERFIFLRRDTKEGDKSIGHETTHWLHEILHPELFREVNDFLPLYPTNPEDPTVNANTLLIESVGGLGGILYKTKNPNSIRHFNFGLPQLLKFNEDDALTNKTQLFYFYYQNFS